MTDDTQREAFGFSIDDETPRVLSWIDGGCRPATDEECSLWDAIHHMREQEFKV